MVEFDMNHVLPECVGNINQQTLPPGIVCTSCNNYFGSKIEPKLLDDPFFHVIAVTLSLIDPDDMNVFRSKLFDQTHPPVGPLKRSINVSANVSKKKVSLDIAYEIQGCITRSYTPKQLRFLSRAVHKIAFEALAHEVFVKGIDNPPELFSSKFEAIRQWTREGRPQSEARPVLRRMGKKISTEWESRFWNFGEEIGCELRLFGDWYGVSLTSAHEEALIHLSKWVGSQTGETWYFSDSMSKLDTTTT
jgi:hypothetical protein